MLAYLEIIYLEGEGKNILPLPFHAQSAKDQCMVIAAYS